MLTQGEFFERLGIGEDRIRSRTPPKTNPKNPDIDFGPYSSEESLTAWAHAVDLEIFFGKTEDHHINPVTFAMREGRTGAPLYRILAFALSAWKHYQEHAEKEVKQGSEVIGKFGPMGNMQGSDHPLRKD